jgi:hypothetical protein
MSKPLTPEITAWLKQAAAAGVAEPQVLCNPLERLEALETAQQPADLFRRATEMAPPPEGSPVATDEEIRKVYDDAYDNSLDPGFVLTLRAVYDLGRQHGAALAQPEGEGRRLAEVDELCAEFGFHYDDQGESLEIPQEMIAAALTRWGRPAAPPAPEVETLADALAARPLLEKVARLGDCIGQQGAGGKVQQLAGQAAAWLRGNPPGQPVAIEPRGCPAPGACSCVEPAPPALEDLATDQMMAANLSALLIEECGLHSPGSSVHDLLQRAAAMLVNYGLLARPAAP